MALVILLAGMPGGVAGDSGAGHSNPADESALSDDSKAGARAAELCARAMAAFSHDAIKFEESTTTFRSSAYPALDRVISLAYTCRDATVVITGHSDSSGDEASNLTLSRERARAVADYLVARGISRARLSVAGVGSSAPVADNGTRYGRSMNRRIDIALRPANGGKN